MLAHANRGPPSLFPEGGTLSKFEIDNCEIEFFFDDVHVDLHHLDLDLLPSASHVPGSHRGRPRHRLRL